MRFSDDIHASHANSNQITIFQMHLFLASVSETYGSGFGVSEAKKPPKTLVMDGHKGPRESIISYENLLMSGGGSQKITRVDQSESWSCLPEVCHQVAVEIPGANATLRTVSVMRFPRQTTTQNVNTETKLSANFLFGSGF